MTLTIAFSVSLFSPLCLFSFHALCPYGTMRTGRTPGNANITSTIAFFARQSMPILPPIFPSLSRHCRYYLNCCLFFLVSSRTDRVWPVCPRTDRVWPVVVKIFRRKNFTFAMSVWIALWAQTVMVLMMIQFLYGEGSNAYWTSQIHLAFMYGPSVFAAYFIGKMGHEFYVTLGFVLMLLACLGVLCLQARGYDFFQKGVTAFMAVLSIGWNICFIGGTSLVSTTFTPQEKFMMQGINDTIVYVLAGVFSFIGTELIVQEARLKDSELSIILLCAALAGLWCIQWHRGYMYNV
eukprot:g597.t1